MIFRLIVKYTARAIQLNSDFLHIPFLFWGLQKIVACPQSYLEVPAYVNIFTHGVIPTLAYTMYHLECRNLTSALSVCNAGLLASAARELKTELETTCGKSTCIAFTCTCTYVYSNCVT